MPTVAEKLTPQTIPGPRFDFKIPDSARQLPGDPRLVVMELPSTLAELEAYQAGGVSIKATYELIQRVVVELDGKPVDQGLPWFDGISPKCRTLLVTALNRITLPSDEERNAFLASMNTTG